MKVNRSGRILALLLCLVMITGQLGMTTFAEEEDDHAHEHVTEAVTENEATPAVTPEQQQPAQPEVPPVTEPESADTGDGAEAGDGQTVTDGQEADGEVSEDKTPAEDETVDGQEPGETVAPEQTPAGEEAGDGQEPEEGETSDGQEPAEGEEPRDEDEEGEETSQGDEPEDEADYGISTMSLEGDIMPIEANNKPEIKATVSKGSSAYGRFFCFPPIIEVTDVDGDLVSVTADKGGSGATVSGTSGSITLSGEGEVTITARDEAGNETTLNIVIGHFIGGREDTVIEPTCEEYGKTGTVYRCQWCGEYYVPSGSALKEDKSKQPLGHDLKGPARVSDSNCGGSDEQEVWTCERCGKQFKDADGNVPYEPTGETHVWKEVTVEAKCGERGYSYEKCDKCGATQNYKETAPLIHQFEWQVTQAATCDNPGRKTQICKVCNKQGRSLAIYGSHTDKYMVLDDSNQYKNQITEKGNWKKEWDEVDRCTQAGYAGYVCTKCFRVDRAVQDERTAPALGHVYAETGDCTQDTHCTRCNDVVPGRTMHAWAGYESDGQYHWRKCANKGCTVQSPKEEHFNYNKSCTTYWVCSTCGKQVEPVADAHNLEWVSTPSGHKQVCTRVGCGYSTPVTKHTGADPKNCQVDWVCTTCDYVIRKAVEGGHKFQENYMNTMTGIHYKSCQNPNCAVRQGEGPHVMTSDPDDCTKGVYCSVCGYVSIHGQPWHNFNGSPWYPDADGNGHHQVCQNKGCKKESASQPHTGGEATCVSQAVCDKCHTAYGQVDPTKHGKGVVKGYIAPEDFKEGYTGDLRCEYCDTMLKKGETIPTKHETEGKHTWEWVYDADGCWKQCSKCHTRDENTYREHELVWEHDESGHWQRCANGCGYTSKVLPHVGDLYDKDCTTPVECTVCHFVMEEAMSHDFSGDYMVSEEPGHLGHYQVCQNPDCGVAGTIENHQYEDDHNCMTEVTCDLCGAVIVEAQSDHAWDNEWKDDGEGNHYQECLSDDCDAILSAPHEPVADDEDCTTPTVCGICHLELAPGEKDHKLERMNADETGHWWECINPGCKYKTTEEIHTGGKATCVDLAVCGECGRPYGETDPDNHVPGHEEIRGHVSPTTESEGFSGDTYCALCDQLLERGVVLPKLTEEQEHSHSFVGYTWDSEKHWQECSGDCGTWTAAEPHTMKWTVTGATHSGECTVCGYVTEVEEHIGILLHDSSGHWGECGVCGAKLSEPENHIWDKNGVCTVCGEEGGPGGEEGGSGGEEGGSGSGSGSGTGSGSNAPQSPQTGDETPVALYAGLLALCAGALVLVLTGKRREQ